LARYIYQKKAVDELFPGMTLGRMLVTHDGKSFMNEGTILTPRMIQNLKLWGFRSVETREEVSEDWRPATASQADGSSTPINQDDIVANLPSTVVDYYNTAVIMMKRTMGQVRNSQDPLDVGELRRVVKECILPLLEDATIVDILHMVTRNDDYLFHHSVDVGIVAGCLARWLGRPHQEVAEIVLGGILHDIGKALIPAQILDKPGELTTEEMDQVRFHSVRGYNFLKQASDLPRSVLYCALQHHERMDGSGYPLSVRSDKIHPYAKIISVADIFDAMTSNRSYGRKATPYEAADTLKNDMYGKLDAQVCSVFLHQVRRHFVGDIVLLSDGRQAEVVAMNTFDNIRPTVKTKDGELINLEIRTDLSISRLLHA
jgi:putative nucleotidyltransferase with HDIG domain